MLYLPPRLPYFLVEPNLLAVIRRALGDACPESKQEVWDAWVRSIVENVAPHRDTAYFPLNDKGEPDENGKPDPERYLLNTVFEIALDSVSFCWEMQGDAVEDPDAVRLVKSALFPAREWSAVALLFFNRHSVQITINETRVNKEYSELGMADRRTEKTTGRPDRTWKALLQFAENGGLWHRRYDHPHTQGYYLAKEDARKRIQILRQRLREIFGLHSDPIPFIPGVGFRTAFTIGVTPTYFEG